MEIEVKSSEGGKKKLNQSDLLLCLSYNSYVGNAVSTFTVFFMQVIPLAIHA